MTTLNEKRKLKSQKLFEAKMKKTEGNKPDGFKVKTGFVKSFYTGYDYSMDSLLTLTTVQRELGYMTQLMFICNALYNSGVEYSKEKALKKVFYAKDVDKYFNYLVTKMDLNGHIRNLDLEKELLELHRRKAANKGFNKMKNEANKIIKNSKVEEEVSEEMQKVFDDLEDLESLLA